MTAPSYIPYLIAKYSTGFDRAVQPWLLPDDAQETLLDGFVYRGVWNKRPGYNYFATGQRNGSTYTESRIVHNIVAEAYGTGNNTVGPYAHTAANAPLSRGSITVTAGGQSATDNGLGGFITSPAGGSGTVNYTTGAMSVTFNGVVAGATPITVTYDYFPGLPVMMVANFYNQSNSRELIVCDTRFINKYNPITNRLVDLPHTTAFTGDQTNFFTWVNYPDASNNPRLLFCNNKDPIQVYDGITSPIVDYVYTMTASGGGAVTVLTCLHMFQMKDRLLLLRTTENGTTYGHRIRISGTGADSDNFNTTATGAGVIDIPDASWIMAASFNRDDLVIFTENWTWILQYTGNDVTPFSLNRLDNSRGSGAPYSGITYLNQTITASPLGFITTDGYRVERIDDKIPTYSFNNIDQDSFKQCFAGNLDQDRDHYLIHPSPGQTISDLILVNNYEENNFSVYRLPLSCMGPFITAFKTTWTDLNTFSNWDEMADVFGNWNDFAYTKGLPFPIGGGHRGQIWNLNVQGIEDNPIKIRNLTVIGLNTLRVETDFNNFVSGDDIYIDGILGMAEANDKQGAITNIVTPNYVFDINVRTERFSAYTGGGTASRVIPFESTTKKFNPFADKAQKIRCGYLYLYVSASDTGIKRNVNIDDITQSNPAIVSASNHQFKTGQEITIYGVAGMTQINFLTAPIKVINANTFSMEGIDSSGFGAYTSGGVAAGPEECFIDIDVITNDNNDVNTQLENGSGQTYQSPYRINCTPDLRDEGSKRWVKIFINQTARFIQFRLRNQQALSKIEIQAMMPGFMGVGRLL